MRRLLFCITIGSGFLLAGPSMAQDTITIFRWVDNKGNLHVTDRLGDIPEPYHSMYTARIRELEERKKQGKALRPTPGDSTPRAASTEVPTSEATSATRTKRKSIVDRELERRKKWIGLVAKWRRELTAATEQVRKIQRELDQVLLNPILRTLPKARQDAERHRRRREQALFRLEAARKMLLETLPARARKDNVPPKWLL